MPDELMASGSTTERRERSCEQRSKVSKVLRGVITGVGRTRKKALAKKAYRNTALYNGMPKPIMPASNVNITLCELSIACRETQWVDLPNEFVASIRNDVGRTAAGPALYAQDVATHLDEQEVKNEDADGARSQGAEDSGIEFA